VDAVIVEGCSGCATVLALLVADDHSLSGEAFDLDLKFGVFSYAVS
jgi:hypothetical protein